MTQKETNAIGDDGVVADIAAARVVDSSSIALGVSLVRNKCSIARE